MATAEQIKALVQSHSERDDTRFYAVAMQVAANEARKGNTDLAAELKAYVDRIRDRSPIPGPPNTVSIAAPRGELAELLLASYPDTKLNDMVLMPKIAGRLRRLLEEQRNIETLKAHNLHPRQRLLLVGPPGCGKTMTASALAGELGLPLLVVRLDALITKFMGETSSKLRLIFDAVGRTRAVYLFDEFDSIGVERGSGADVGEIRRVLNSFLMLIERHAGTSLLIAATNHGQSLDRALFRRFDDILEFPLPDADLREQMLRQRLASTKWAETPDWNAMRRAAGRMSFAEIAKACNEAMKRALLSRAKGLKTEDVLEALSERLAFQRKRRRAAH